MQKGRLFVISGPSGAGKGTICKEILENENIRLSVSMTTRAPRDGEIDGVNYFFVSKEGISENYRRTRVFGIRGSLRKLLRNSENGSHGYDERGNRCGIGDRYARRVAGKRKFSTGSIYFYSAAVHGRTAETIDGKRHGNCGGHRDATGGNPERTFLY